MRRRLFNVLLVLGIIFFSASLVFGLKGSSASYDVFSKFDFGATGNSSSSSFTNRFISGNQPVGTYSQGTTSGRFGVLSTLRQLEINLTYPVNNQEIVRGGDSVDNEDDLGLISNSINLTAKVFTTGTSTGFNGATCYFYDNASLIGSSSTNSSGDCQMNWTKGGFDVGVRELKVNYTISTSDVKVVDSSSVNVSIAKYLAKLSLDPSHAGKYYDGEVATLTINTTVTNSSGVFAYNVSNLKGNATTSAGNLYPNGTFEFPVANVTETGVGIYTTNTTVDYSFSSLLKWNVLTSNDDYASLLSSAVHEDVAICSGDFGDWGTCSGDVQSRTDSSGCVETQSCGTTASCFPKGTLIKMSDGTDKKIEDVKIGDKVLSYDFLEGEQVFAEVLELESPIREGYYDVGGVLNVTDEHPMYVRKKSGEVGWGSINVSKTYEDLGSSYLEGKKLLSVEIGDSLFNSEGEWITIDYLKYVEGEIQTYNLKSVDKYNVFYAAGFLAHNKGDGDSCTNECTAGEEEISCVTTSTLRTRTCGNFDSDSCTEWEPNPDFSDCGTNQCLNAQCVDECVEDWQCSGWSQCLSGSQTRNCNDLSACGTTNNQPSLTQGCETCVEDWSCEYSICEEGDSYSEPYDCVDSNACGTRDDLPTETISCEEVEEKYIPIDENSVCNPRWDCGDWNECSADYTLNDVLLGKVSVGGSIKRTCVDVTNCAYDKTDKKSCEINVPVYSQTVNWCEEDYLEIREKDSDKLVSRIKEEQVGENLLKRFNIDFILGEFEGYCNYCRDGVKNHDETGVDCGGPSCSACQPPYEFFDWLFYVIIFLWSLSFVIVIDIFRKREKVRKRVPLTQVEANVERAVSAWFKKKLPFRLTVSRVERRPFEVVPIRKVSTEESLLARLKRRLRALRRRGYYGTRKIEGEISRLEYKVKKREHSFVSIVRRNYNERKEARAKTKAENLRIRERIKRERLIAKEQKRLHRKSLFASFFSSVKMRSNERRIRNEKARAERLREKEILRNERARAKEKQRIEKLRLREEKLKLKEKQRAEVLKKREQSHKARGNFFSSAASSLISSGASLFASVKKKREQVKKHREFKKKIKQEARVRRVELKRVRKENKKKTRLFAKANKFERKEKRREKKKVVRSLKREIRRQKISNLMNKLRIWKKEGYYGTAKLEEELRRLKSRKD